MKTTHFILTILVIATLKCSAQKENYFEGIIIYDADYTSTSDQVNTKSLERDLGTSTKFYFKEGNYYQASDDAKEVAMCMRSVKDKRIYFGNKRNDTVTYVDFSNENETIIEQKLDDSTVYNINGYDCFKFQVKAKRIKGGNVSSREYYFSPKHALNPDWFIGTTYSNEYLKFKTIKSLPLKIVLNYGVVTITLTARDVEWKKIDNSMFELPAKAIVVEKND